MRRDNPQWVLRTAAAIAVAKAEKLGVTVLDEAALMKMLEGEPPHGPIVV